MIHKEHYDKKNIYHQGRLAVTIEEYKVLRKWEGIDLLRYERKGESGLIKGRGIIGRLLRVNETQIL